MREYSSNRLSVVKGKGCGAEGLEGFNSVECCLISAVSFATRSTSCLAQIFSRSFLYEYVKSNERDGGEEIYGSAAISAALLSLLLEVFVG